MKRIERLNPVRPEWAKALIVAELDQDKCDIMTDYFHTTVTSVVALAWSRHTRDMFSEMRKAAALYGPTRHLGPGKGIHKAAVVIDWPESFDNGGFYMHKGEKSPWHGEECPERTFETGDEALAYVSSMPVPEPVLCSGTQVSFRWDISDASIEHREKWSMGHGYYLKAGGRYDSGWVVRKWTVNEGRPFVFHEVVDEEAA